ncbi:uncharacterized protein LOC116342960 isoform X2 [Contarinia nasturtii]|uniref:uncharacterized protein LOC116342960 isoform X2 n=1 Tax=Contarinia nasturtii TaxID=265458 RepID=UPI0012D3DB46|nr:uncharacterized protein LOC116342960 isoform X2 [Contarinia nasturtii]
MFNRKIKFLNDINAQLNERYEIKSKYNALKTELKEMEDLESTRKVKFNKDRKKNLIQMEHIGQDLCEEHSKVIHQIEHINWHLSHAHPHEITTPIELPIIPPKICHADGILSGRGHGHIHGKLHCSNKPSANMGYLQISAERLIKTISELRHKICQARQNLEHETERKRAAEKNLTELRKQVSKQKKLMSMRRCVPLPAITTVRKCVK